jgi:hypothetical protein
MSETCHDKDSVNNLLFDVVALGCYIGPCLSKYAQTSQDKVDLHTYPSGTTVMKAFVARNFIFYDNKKCISKVLNEASLNNAISVKITWRIQTYHQNNQVITLAADMANPAIHPVCIVMQLVLCACCLLQPDNMPVLFQKTKKGKTFYLTGNKFAKLLRKTVRKVHSDTTSDNLKKYSANLLSIWACIFAR